MGGDVVFSPHKICWINSADSGACDSSFLRRQAMEERFDGEEEGHLREILEPDPIRLTDLVGYEIQKKEIINNTKHFLNGLPANNLLLYGSRGTGKSSTVKAILNEYYEEGLRLIEVDKEQLSDFTRIIRLLKNKKQKFITKHCKSSLY